MSSRKDKGDGQERKKSYLSNLASADIFLTSLQFVFSLSLFLPFYYYTYYWVSNIAENRTQLDKWPIKQGQMMEWTKRWKSEVIILTFMYFYCWKTTKNYLKWKIDFELPNFEKPCFLPLKYNTVQLLSKKHGVKSNYFIKY